MLINSGEKRVAPQEALLSKHGDPENSADRFASGTLQYGMYTVAAFILVHYFIDEVAPAACCSGFLLQPQPALRMLHAYIMQIQGHSAGIGSSAKNH